MKVLGLASYPIQAAATRYRLEQFVKPLAERGIVLRIRPFLDANLFEQVYQNRALLQISAGLLKSGLLRIKDVIAASQADVILVQREAMIFGPPLIEWLAARVCRIPLVLDLDDATYVAYSSPTYGRIARTLKWFSKTDDLIDWSRIVICGNRAIAEYAASKGAKTCVIPTVVDTEVFRPAVRAGEGLPVLGWIGTHSTFPYLESIFPVLQQLAKKYPFRLRIVGAGRDEITVSGVEVENLKWELHREIKDFQSLDIGLYPIDTSLYAKQWAMGKSGFKAIQYMAVGIPYVATPVGAAAEIGEAGTTHFSAKSAEDWYVSLESLLSDRERREQMGAAGRSHVTKYYGFRLQTDRLAQALREAAGEGAAAS